ncbi:MAG: response regulator [Labilithrix sp.]|nr:response regulator [Labilithrix sp.]MCW5837451.1 response regulator [Labilithrix sp.]
MTTILAIEDDADLRELLRFVLEERGYAVATAENGREALECVLQQMPDLILLDIRMPIMSGADFAAEYRTRYEQSSRAPLIVMTAAEHAARRSTEIGASDFLRKPFSTDELITLVERHAQARLSAPAAGA